MQYICSLICYPNIDCGLCIMFIRENGHAYTLYICTLKMWHMACAFKKHVQIREMQAEVGLRVICHVLRENPFQLQSHPLIAGSYICDFWYHCASCQDISAKSLVSATWV